MHSPQDIADFMQATKASPPSVQRVSQAVVGSLAALDVQAALQQGLPTPGASAAQRVQARVLASGVRPRTLWPLRAGLGLGAVAFGTAALAGVAWLMPSDRPLDGEITTEALSWSGASVAADGKGSLAGTELEPQVVWDAGTVTVDGVVTVRTREAVIRADGPTVVTRDVYGTRSTGSHTVVCLAEYPVPADTEGCPPVSASGLLARSVALRADGATPAVQLQWLALAANASGPALASDVRAVQVAAHYEAGDTDRVLALANEHLRMRASERRQEVALYGASVALGMNDCPAAMPFLRVLAPTDPDAALNLAACATRDAELALDEAMRQARGAEDREQIQQLRSGLRGEP